MPQHSKLHGRVSTSDKTKLPLKKKNKHITNDKLVSTETGVYEMKTHVKNAF